MQIIIYIINLKKASKRKEEIKELITRILPSFKYEFIKAVDGYKLSEVEIKEAIDIEKRKKFKKRALSLGEIGCLLSHKKALKALLESSYKACLILEDDAFFDERLASFLKHLYELPKDLELLLIGHQRQVYEDDGFRIESPYSRRFKQLVGGLTLRRLVSQGNGGYGYYITKKGAQKLQKATQKAFKAIDNYTCDEEYINIYALFPPLIMTNPKYLQESSTQESFTLKKRSLLRKNFKKLSIFLRFFIKSLRKLKKYE